jgi:hypothetical protein
LNQAPIQISPDQVGRSAQILVGALIMGLVFFGSIAVMVRQDKTVEMGVLAYLGAGMAALMILISLIMPGQITRDPIRRLAEQRPEDWKPALAGLYQTKTIVANALLEGSGFFNGVAYLIHGHWMSLAIMGVLVALMAITFPSQSQFETWAEQVRRDHS